MHGGRAHGALGALHGRRGVGLDHQRTADVERRQTGAGRGGRRQRLGVGGGGGLQQASRGGHAARRGGGGGRARAGGELGSQRAHHRVERVAQRGEDDGAADGGSAEAVAERGVEGGRGERRQAGDDRHCGGRRRQAAFDLSDALRGVEHVHTAVVVHERSGHSLASRHTVLERADGRLRRRGGEQPHSPALQLPDERRQHALVVAHHQHRARQLLAAAAAGLRWLERVQQLVAPLAALAHGGVYGEGEDAALPLLALRPHLAAHLPCEALADDQPQPCAAVQLVGVHLRERAEQLAQLVRRDADARVAHAEQQHHAAARLRCALLPCDAHHHLLAPGRVLRGCARRAVLGERAHRTGEFEGIRQEVSEDLPQPCYVAVHHCGHVRRHAVVYVQLRVRVCAVSELQRLLDGRLHVDGRVLELELARLRLAKVQHVVQQREQVLARHRDRVDHVELLLAQRTVGQHRRVAQHAVHRGADLVRHVGEEAALGAARSHRLSLRLLRQAALPLRLGLGALRLLARPLRLPLRLLRVLLALPQLPLRFLQLLQRVGESSHALLELELRHSLLGEYLQALELLGRQLARLVVDGADGAERVSVAAHDGRARVEANVRVAAHQRVVGEANVRAGVGHHEHVAHVEYAVAAEGVVARGLARLQSDLGFEPLPVRVDERDERDGRLADLRREEGEVVERLLGGRVEYAVGEQGGHALVLVVGEGSGHAALDVAGRRSEGARGEGGRRGGSGHGRGVQRSGGGGGGGGRLGVELGRSGLSGVRWRRWRCGCGCVEGWQLVARREVATGWRGQVQVRQRDGRHWSSGRRGSSAECARGVGLL